MTRAKEPAKLKRVNDTLESKRTNLESEFLKLCSLQDKEKDTRDLLLKNKSKLKQLWQEIRNLGVDDRKLLVEAMVRDRKIIVDCGDTDFPEEFIDSKGKKRQMITVDFKHRFNPDILQRFMDEKKLKRLFKDSPDYSNKIIKKLLDYINHALPGP
jgi:hypothetical protein